MHRKFIAFLFLLLHPVCQLSAATNPALKKFAEKMIEEQENSYVMNPLSALVDVPFGTKYKGYEITSVATTDKLNHVFSVSTDAAHVLFQTTYKWPENSEHFLFRSSIRGTLIKVVSSQGKRDKDGNIIRGSGNVTTKDIYSPEIKQRFQHELDFWLKGAYRKQASKEKPLPKK